ncbi:hypothetical protein [Teredinibacter franksiae]|nr:hypothetical protein [Teredinibacter franksiae]
MRYGEVSRLPEAAPAAQRTAPLRSDSHRAQPASEAEGVPEAKRTVAQ